MQLQSQGNGRMILASAVMVSLAIVFLAIQLRKGLEGSGAGHGGHAVLDGMQAVSKSAVQDAVPATQRQAGIAPQNTVFAATFMASELSADDPVYGSPDAPKSLVAFMDFQCGFCSAFYPTAHQVVDESKGKVNLVFKHFPLSAGSPSDALHNAAECVASVRGAQGFYQFVADAYSPAHLNPATIGNYLRDAAKGTDAETAKFAACLEKREFSQKIARSRALGDRVGVAGTPAVMAYNRSNGKAIFQIGNVPPEKLREMLAQIN